MWIVSWKSLISKTASRISRIIKVLLSEQPYNNYVTCFIEKTKDLKESSTWALSNFLREVTQSKDTTVYNNNNNNGRIFTLHFNDVAAKFR